MGEEYHMPKLKYEVKLNEAEKERLIKIIKTGKSPASEILHANILLATDDNRMPKLTVAEVAEKCGSNTTTVQSVRKSFAENGLETAIYRKKRETPPIAPKITGDVEARIIAVACSEPPEGFSKWSLRLLADRVVELEYIDKISYVSVGTVLKKHNLSLT
jgi:hypothetical protein